MKVCITVWASFGLLVAACWAVYAFVTPPDSFLTSVRQPVVKAALYLSCPVAYTGRYYPIQLWWVLAINAATYAAVGLVLELLRLKTKPHVLA